MLRTEETLRNFAVAGLRERLAIRSPFFFITERTGFWIADGGAPAALPWDKNVALANGGQKASSSAKSRCLPWRPPAAKDGQRRSYADKTVLLWPLVRRSPPNELAAYRGQRRTKWRRGDSGLMIVIRHSASVRARRLMTSD
jgi:hypothetical protein